MATAATEVTSGSSTPMRNSVGVRILRFSAFASSRASSSCGTVAITNMPNVLPTAFQNWSSVSRRV